MDDELTVLRVLHRVIGDAICEQSGHDWRDIPSKPGSTTMNPPKWERCRTCNETRVKPDQESTSNTGFSFNVAEEL